MKRKTTLSCFIAAIFIAVFYAVRRQSCDLVIFTLFISYQAMAEGGSSRAWEILASYEREFGRNTDVDDVDTFLGTPPEGHHQLLVDGWTSILSPNVPFLPLELSGVDIITPPSPSDNSVKPHSPADTTDATGSDLPENLYSNVTQDITIHANTVPDNTGSNGTDIILKDALQLIQCVDEQLGNDESQDPGILGVAGISISNRVEGIADKDVSPDEDTEHNVVSLRTSNADPSLGAVEDIIDASFSDILNPLDEELSSLSANLAQCMLEKSLLEADIQMEEQRLQDLMLQSVPYGDAGEERFQMYPELENYQQEPQLNNEVVLEQQIIEFITGTNTVFCNRIAKWTNDLQNELECESIESEEQDRTPSISDLPDEILLRILSYIPIMENLLVLSLVSKRWYILAADPSLWQHLYIATDAALDPHWLCYMVKRAPQLKSLSIRGGHNLRKESLSVFTLYCPQLTTVNFGFCSMTEPMLKTLVSRCPNISYANFEGCDTVTSDWIRTLCLLQKLVSVNISYCQVLVDEDIVYLSENLSGLVNVNIDGNSFLSDMSVVPLCHKHVQTLVTLSIDGAESTDRSIEAATACANLALLTVSFAEYLTSTSIEHLLKTQWLCHLQIRKSPILDTESFCKLFQFNESMQHLRHLDLSECTDVIDSVVEALCHRCPRLVRLILGWCWNITDSGVDVIVRSCSNLEYLDLLGLELINGHSFDLLPGMLPKLTFLNLVQCNRVDDSLIRRVLDRMPQLTAINYYHEDFRTAI